MPLSLNVIFCWWEVKINIAFTLNSIEMKERKRVKKRKRVNKPLVIVSLAIVIVISLYVVSYLSQLQRGSQKKLPADEYFEIFEQTVNDGEFLDPKLDEGGSYENSSRLLIFSISYKLRAVGGDAHNVVVGSWGPTENFEEFEVILNGQYGYVEQGSIRTGGGFMTKKAENGKFPFPVKLTSDEAEGTITIYL